MPKITLVYDEDYDWTGLYLDGKCVYQNHSIEDRHLLQLLGIEFEVKEVYMNSGDKLPTNLDEIKNLKDIV